eukprot:scaffold21225_cov55-Phaeocystis_antarctica.AAC.4
MHFLRPDGSGFPKLSKHTTTTLSHVIYGSILRYAPPGRRPWPRPCLPPSRPADPAAGAATRVDHPQTRQSARWRRRRAPIRHRGRRRGHARRGRTGRRPGRPVRWEWFFGSRAATAPASRRRAPGWVRVELRDGGGGGVAGVGHGQYGAQDAPRLSCRPLAADGGNCAATEARRAKGEGRVGQAVPKGESGLRGRVASAVAGGEALGVPHRLGKRGRDGLGLRGGQRDWQPPRRRHVAKEHVGPGVAALLPTQEEHGGGGHRAAPRREERARRGDERDGLRRRRGDGRNERVAAVVEREVGPVDRLARGRAPDDDDDVDSPCQRHRSAQVVGGAEVHRHARRPRPRRDATQRRDHRRARGDVATAAARVVVALVPAALPLAGARRVIHPCVGGGADDGDGPHARRRERQHAIVLQQHDASGGGGARERRMRSRGDVGA